MIFVSHTTGTASHWATPAAGHSRAVNLYKAEVDESKCQVQRHFVEGELSKDMRILPGRCSQSCLPWPNYTITWTPGRPFHDTAQAALNLSISSLLSACMFVGLQFVLCCVYMWWVHSPSIVDWLLSLFVKRCVCSCVHVVEVCIQDVMCWLHARAYSALLSKWCFSTSSFGGDVKLSVWEYVILLLVIPLKRDFKNKQNTGYTCKQIHSKWCTPN